LHGQEGAQINLLELGAIQTFNLCKSMAQALKVLFIHDFISCPSLAYFPLLFEEQLLEVDELDAILLGSFRTQMPDLQWLVMRAQK
jgi:hypothetical protein